ncbi:unnamed protein product [Polarella glacialis]|uniref:Choline transporter-like protein n=1 Tax=Polarella glacialis TaxID=89957 RepID=A0A813KPQ9_POLGL|nr:unnamed protein product [Polarella glacialis]CAE8705885.1 unnamed protein product [Polarella glacialis]
MATPGSARTAPFQHTGGWQKQLDEEPDDEHNESSRLQTQRPAQNFVDDEDLGYSPTTVPRSCTDCFWIPLFLLALAGYVYMGWTAWSERKFYDVMSLPDFQGMPCGHEYNSQKPYLFFCYTMATQFELEVDKKELDKRYPICVETCPSSWEGTVPCFEGNGVFAEVRTYASIPYLGALCRPAGGHPGNHMYTDIMDYFMIHRPDLLVLSTLERSSEILVCVACVAILGAFAYMAFLGAHARSIVWFGLTLFILAPLVAGSFSLSCTFVGNTCGKVFLKEEVAKPVGFALIALGVCIACAICQAKHQVDTAVLCMQFSCQCVSACPSLRVAPLLKLLGAAAVTAANLLVMLCLWSMIFSEDILSKQAFSFDRHRLHCFAMAAVVFMEIWIVGINNQLINFGEVYAVQTWYFEGKKGLDSPAASLLRGIAVAIRYHLGTCIFAGLVIPLVIPIRAPLLIITRAAKNAQNPVCAIMHGCCDCLVDFYFDNLEGLCIHSLYDVSLQATPWCHSVQHSTVVVVEEGSAGEILQGATWLFEAAGLGLFAVLGHFSGRLILLLPRYSDPLSEQFVGMSQSAHFAASVVGVLAAFPFLDLFRIVSDSVLYCKTVEKQRAWHAPGTVAGALDRACTVGFADAFESMLCLDGRAARRDVQQPPYR